MRGWFLEKGGKSEEQSRDGMRIAAGMADSKTRGGDDRKPVLGN